MDNTFGPALAAYVTALQEKINADWARLGYTHDVAPVVSTEAGSKYVRIVTRQSTSGSVHTFVRMADGAILYSAGWKKPFIAKGGPNCPATVRGSIYAPDHGMSAVGVHGANYAR